VEADGAKLVFDAYAGGVLDAHLAFVNGDEDAREYVLPAAQLVPMLEALLKPRFPGLMRVRLRDPRTDVS
jgi:hypothetical protein